MDNNENIEKLEAALEIAESNEYVIYFLTYDTKNNARAGIKHIYDIALTLHNYGFKSKILVEEKAYTGVKSWLGDKYDALEIVTIKEDKIQIRVEDVIVVPEYYSNVLEQLSNVKCVKIMLIQQAEHIYETLSIGSKWINFGFDKV